MTTTVPFNTHGDTKIEARAGYGTEVSIQRADDLDQMALADMRQRTKPAYALDIACGQGGQAIRLIQAGAEKVVAFDLEDYGAQIAANARAAGIDPAKIIFIRGDARALKDLLPKDMVFSVICSQRAQHYFRYAESVGILSDLKAFATPDAGLYISASGMGGEEGAYYPHGSLPVEERFCLFDEPMLSKQNVTHPLCLYSELDMAKLLEAGSWPPMKIFTSPFGTIKAAARNRVPTLKSAPLAGPSRL